MSKNDKMKVDQFYREFLREYENQNRGENIMKSKLLPFIAIGAVVGAAISMLDKKTREHTVDTAKKAKETVTYYAENRDELAALIESKVEQAQNLYGNVNETIQSLAQNGNDIFVHIER